MIHPKLAKQKHEVYIYLFKMYLISFVENKIYGVQIKE